MNPELKTNTQTKQAQMDDRQARCVGSGHDSPALTLPFPLRLSGTHHRVEGTAEVFGAFSVSVI